MDDTFSAGGLAHNGVRVRCWALSRGDAFEWLDRSPSRCVDLIVTDPPYESLEKHRAKGTTTRLKVSDGSSNEWFETIPNARLPELFQQLYRVLRDDRHCYFICDQETMFAAKAAAERAGFTFWKPLIWDKVTIGMGYHYRARYEVIMFLEKGKRKLNDLGIPDILTAKRVRGGYPTEKPVELLRTLIRQSATRGEVVCDPFAGSGSTGEAALEEGCQFTGCDISPKAYAASKARLTGWLERQPSAHWTAIGG